MNPLESALDVSKIRIDQYLRQGGILVADGAAGTMLMAAGLPAGAPPDLWNVEQPEKILALHRAYLQAGSQVILTNTFGANRKKLERSGLADRAQELSKAGAALARQAAGRQAFVAGDMGPTGELMQPMGSLTYDEALAAYTEQAAALAEGGVDAIWIETMTDLDECRAAVTAARQATDLPVLCSLSFGRKARTLMGVSARQAIETLWPLGLTAIGANCGDGLDPVEEALRQMKAAVPDAPLIAKPNAGIPHLVGNETVYDTPPADFAKRLGEFIGLGAQIAGACCGSNPDYIRAIAHAVTGEAGA